MGLKKTIGGDRLGSGKRMKQEMHNFYRSNHNLSKTWKSTMAPGVLYPCYCNLALPGDTFDFNIGAFMRTVPTQGPLFGSFKLQIDVFSAPIRLYQGVLHNNPVEIGLKMNQVKLPKIEITNKFSYLDIVQCKEHFSPSCLMKYLGLSGIGQPTIGNAGSSYSRKFNAVPVLAYYDIFKNYYANKQEEKAYVISADEVSYETSVESVTVGTTTHISNPSIPFNIFAGKTITIFGENLTPETVLFEGEDIGSNTLAECVDNNEMKIMHSTHDEIKVISLISDRVIVSGNGSINTGKIALVDFPLKNIDTMRYELLKSCDLGEEYVIDSDIQLPYAVLTKRDVKDKTYNSFAMNGLCVKTYQSDLFNNWIDTEWIDGVNGINELSAVSTATGKFTIDALNLAEKVYNMLNRIALSGGTYQDWLEAVWSYKTAGAIEKPMYHGGMSSEVVFEEVVSTAATEEDALGTLGGRGTMQTRKGGNVVIRVNEPSFIMAIISLTPRVDYTQGNKWYLTELDTLDDVHKPSLDQIGFQDLMVEQMAWWDAKFVGNTIQRTSAGKQPAWLNYMTDVDEAFGDFANEEGFNYMVLSRNYTKGINGDVQDVTTYIDPRKFNYAFAYSELDAQNFWGFVKFDIKARRMMSARQIPNL